MVFFKRIVVSLCFCLLFMKPAKAFWPVFDFTEIIPVYSQVSTGVDQLKNLKEQIKELEETLKSIGKGVNNLSSFAKDISDFVDDVSKAVDNATSVVNENLASNNKIEENMEDLAGDVADANGELANSVTESANDIILGENNNGRLAEPRGERLSIKIAPQTDIEEGILIEEEEEEEVSKEEERAQIEKINETINFALEEGKAISIQFNDVLDVSINTIHQNIEKNNAIMDNMVSVIYKAENLTEEEKESIKKEIELLKQRQENLSINIIGIIEGIKGNYNKMYKDRIEDGYNNYKKVAVSYILGDKTKEDFIKSGTKLKENINAINILPDKQMVTGVKVAINSLQKEIGYLGKKIKKIEEENKKYNS